MAFDPLTWAIGFGAGRAATKLLDRIGEIISPTPLSGELMDAFRSWADELPENATVHSDALMAAMFMPPDEQAGPARTAIGQAFEDKQLATAETWLAALMERWVEVASSDGELQAFFRITPAEARTHLRELSAALYRVCGRDPAMFQTAVLASQQEIERKLDGIRLMLESDRAAPSAAELEERLRAFSSALLRYPTTLTPGGEWIARPELMTLLERIRYSPSSLSVVIGERGSGKSALLANMAARVRKAGWALLGIKADLLPVAAGTAFRQIGGDLELEAVIATVARTKKVVVIIDQVDAIAEILDRTTDRLNVVLNLVHRIAETPNVHVILSSREFEYRTDARLTSLACDELQLQLPPWSEVAPVVARRGHDPEAMSEVLRGLLRNPWTLKVFLEVAQRDEHFASLSALLDRVWTNVVAAGAAGDRRVTLLDRIVARMIEEEEFSVPAAMADADPLPLETLLSAGILVREKQKLTFRHQTFFEYTAARRFGAGSADFLQHILGRQDGLFVRPTIVTTLVLLRDTRPQAYARIVNAIVAHPEIRLHVKILAVDFVASQKAPLPAEMELVPRLFEDDRYGRRILDAIGGSTLWFAVLRDDERFLRWLDEPERARRCLALLDGAIRQTEFRREVLGLVAARWLPRKDFDPLLDELLRVVFVPPEPVVAAMVELLVIRSDLYGAFRILEGSDPRRALRLMARDLEARLRDFQIAAAEDPENAVAALALFVRQYPIRVRSMIEPSPVEYVQTLWGPLMAIFEAVAQPIGDEVLIGSPFDGLIDYRDVWPSPYYQHADRPLVSWVATAIAGFARQFPDEFFDFAETCNSEHRIVHDLLCSGWIILADRHPARIADFLLRDPRRLVSTAAPTLVQIVHWQVEQYERMALEAAIATLPSVSSMLEARAHVPERLTFGEYKGTLDYIKIQYEQKPPADPRKRLIKVLKREHVLTSLRDEISLERERASQDTLAAPPVVDETDRVSLEQRLARMSDVEVLQYLDEHRTVSGSARQVGRVLSVDPRRLPRLLKTIVRDETSASADLLEWLPAIVPMDVFLDTIIDLDRRGFTITRSATARQLRRRIAEGADPGPEIADMMERWLEESPLDLAAPALPVENPIARFEPLLGGEYFVGGTKLRGEIFATLSLLLAAAGQAGRERWLAIVRRELGREHHPSFWHIVLRDLSSFFAKDRDAGAQIVAEILAHEPLLLTQPITIWLLGRLFRHFDERSAFDVLDRLRAQPYAIPRQALAELLFICPSFTPAAEAELRERIAGGEPAPLAGAGYGATYVWNRRERRGLAVDALVAVAVAGDEALDDVLQRFVVDRQSERVLDPDTERVLEAIAKQSELSRETTTALLDVLQAHTVARPAFVLRVTSTLIERLGSDFDDLTRPFFAHAGAMTAIAITLHRQPAYRVEGLALFEQLLEFNAREAHAAIEILDRRPGVRYQSVSWYRPAARPRRTRLMMADA